MVVRHFIKKANDISLGKKIMALFVVCVLIPLITTNGFIFWSMKQGMDTN